MRKVVHRVYAPLVTRLVVGDVSNTVDNGVTHIDVGGSHINLCTKHAFAVCKFALCHSLEKVKVFLDASVTVGAVFAGLGKRAAVFSDFVRSEVADVSLAVLDELYSTFVYKIKIAGGIVALVPLEAEPLNVFLNGVNVLNVLLGGVGVVKTEVAYTAVLFCRCKVNADGLGVAYVEIAVGLGWETGLHSRVDTCG